MCKKVYLTVIFLLTITTGSFAQSDIKITKKSETKMPGMPTFSDQDLSKMPPAAQERMKNRLKRESVVYVKGSRMRTDMEFEVPSGLKMEKRRQTIIQQCDKQRMISFNDKKKKYTVNNFGNSSTATTRSAQSSAKPTAGGGIITVSLNVTDTGERAKLFGYDARHIRQIMTITPGGNSCLKSKMQMEIDGWYADVPGFSCSLKPDTTSMQTANNCSDEVRYEVTGSFISMTKPQWSALISTT